MKHNYVPDACRNQGQALRRLRVVKSAGTASSLETNHRHHFAPDFSNLEIHIGLARVQGIAKRDT